MYGCGSITEPSIVKPSVSNSLRRLQRGIKVQTERKLTKICPVPSPLAFPISNGVILRRFCLPAVLLDSAATT